MEQENIESSHVEQDLNVDSSVENQQDSGYQPENEPVETNESEDVSNETNEYEPEQESETDRLRRELEDLKERQYQHDMQMRQMYAPRQDEEPRELTHVDIVREAIAEIKNQEMEVAMRSQQDRLDYEFKQNIESFSRKVKDFDSVVRRINCITPAMLEMIKASDEPGSLAYHAAKSHEEELRRISTLSSPQQQMREMVRLEDKIRNSLKPRTVSRTPTPLGDPTGSAGLANDEFGNKSTGELARMLRERSKKR